MTSRFYKISAVAWAAPIPHSALQDHVMKRDLKRAHYFMPIVRSVQRKDVGYLIVENTKESLFVTLLCGT